MPERKDFQVQVSDRKQAEPIATQTDSSTKCDFQSQANIPRESVSMETQTIKDNLHLNCLSMKNPSPISPSKPPGQVLYPARFKYKSSLSTNLFPVIKPKLAQMQSNSTDFTISNLAKFGDWQQNLKLPSSQIASLLSVTPVVTSPISTDKNPDEDDQ